MVAGARLRRTSRRHTTVAPPASRLRYSPVLRGGRLASGLPGSPVSYVHTPRSLLVPPPLRHPGMCRLGPSAAGGVRALCTPMLACAGRSAGYRRLRYLSQAHVAPGLDPAARCASQHDPTRRNRHGVPEPASSQGGSRAPVFMADSPSPAR